MVVDRRGVGMMASGRFAENPNYVEFERLLIRLNELMARGEGETDDADSLREQMYDLRQGLSPDEEAQLRGLSADLYMLQNDEVFEKVDPAEWPRERLESELKRAWEASDWEGVLGLLRKGPGALSDDQRASARSVCYAALGRREVGLLFAEHALRLKPGDGVYLLAVMQILRELGRGGEALERANVFAQEHSGQPYALALLRPVFASPPGESLTASLQPR
jgi:hypothetical protein